MRTGNELFELIDSLTKNEKRYIKVNSTRHNSKNKIYADMFSAICKSDSANEKQFRLKNKNQKFIKNYSFNKFYLYKLVLKYLAEYNREKSVDGKIQNMIMECKVLFAKTLYRQYFKSIQRAKNYALKHERYGFLLQILEMEKIIIKKEEIQTEKGNAIYMEALSAIEHLNRSFEFSRISNELLSRYRFHGLQRDKTQEFNISRLFNHRIINSQEDFSPKELEAYYRINEIAYEMQADYENSYKMQVKRLKNVQDNPHSFKDTIISYELDILSSILNTSLKLDMVDEAEKYLQEYRLKDKDKLSDLGDSEIIETLIKFQINIKKNDLAGAKLMIPELDNILIKYHNKILIDTELTIRYYITVYFILIGDFENALARCNSLLSHPLIEKREDYHSYLKILTLIIHFELKNYSLLGYLIKSTYRFLLKHKKLYKIEAVVLEFIRKLPEINNEEDLMFSLKKYQNELKKLKADNFEKNAFEYFDFLKWIEAKVS